MASISEAEYEQWILPRELVAMLGGVGNDALEVRSLILHKVRDAELLAVADVVIVTSDASRSTDTKRRWMLSDAEWTKAANNSAFWHRGEAVYQKRTSLMGATRTYTCTGIRFEHSTAAALARTYAPAARPKRQRSPPPLAASTARSVAPGDGNPDDPSPDDFENKPAEADFARWHRPAQALAMRGDLSADAAIEVFLIRMKGGVMPTFAGLAKWFREGKQETETFAPFPWQWWDRVEVENAYDLFWRAPVADLVVESDRKGPPIYFFDIRFDPDAVEAMFGLPPRDFASTPPQSSAKTSNQRRRGPPPKPFWGDAMADVEAGIRGGVIPAFSLADVERAIQGWLIDNGQNAAESTIRVYADKVWTLFDPEGR